MPLAFGSVGHKAIQENFGWGVSWQQEICVGCSQDAAKPKNDFEFKNQNRPNDQVFDDVIIFAGVNAVAQAY